VSSTRLSVVVGCRWGSHLGVSAAHAGSPAHSQIANAASKRADSGRAGLSMRLHGCRDALTCSSVGEPLMWLDRGKRARHSVSLGSYQVPTRECFGGLRAQSRPAAAADALPAPLIVSVGENYGVKLGSSSKMFTEYAQTWMIAETCSMGIICTPFMGLEGYFIESRHRCTCRRLQSLIERTLCHCSRRWVIAAGGHSRQTLWNMESIGVRSPRRALQHMSGLKH